MEDFILKAIVNVEIYLYKWITSARNSLKGVMAWESAKKMKDIQAELYLDNAQVAVVATGFASKE